MPLVLSLRRAIPPGRPSPCARPAPAHAAASARTPCDTPRKAAPLRVYFPASDSSAPPPLPRNRAPAVTNIPATRASNTANRTPQSDSNLHGTRATPSQSHPAARIPANHPKSPALRNPDIFPASPPPQLPRPPPIPPIAPPAQLSAPPQSPKAPYPHPSASFARPPK